MLAVGVNRNYHNDSANSLGLAQSVSADIAVLRAMLDAGGDPNPRDVKGQPIVFDNWSYSKGNVHSGYVSCSIAEPT